MKSALITGIQGFVGTYLARHLLESGYRVTGVDRPGVKPELYRQLFGIEHADEITIHACDLTEVDEIRALVAGEEFDCIFHLAGIAFVPEGWRDPAGMLRTNTLGTVYLLQGARDVGWKGRFLYVSSSDVYGSPSREDLPLTENYPVRPESPYGTSKLAAEQFALYFCRDGIDVIVARPFNHIGPGQNVSFVVPSFIARIEAALRDNLKSIPTGDIKSERDFTDVRDVVHAYRMLIEKAAAGETYNVCTGNMVSMEHIFDLVIKVAGADLGRHTDESLLRPEGPNFRCGSAEKLKKLGWQPQLSLEESIRDIYNFMNRTIPV